MSTQNYYPQQPPQFSGNPPAPAKKKSKAPKVIGIIVVVVLLLALLAEFGTRWYIKREITNSMQDASNSREIEDPEVKLGKSPVLLGLLSMKLPHLEIEVPSSISVDYEDNDPSRPVVSGMPRTHITGENLKMGESAEEMVFSEMTIETEVPKEVMLAEMSSAMSQQTGDNMMAALLQVNDVIPDPSNQTMEIQFTGGLASIVMAPKLQDGQMSMEIEGVKLLGQDLPDSVADALRGSAEDSVQQNTPGGLQAKDVRVTRHGLEITLHGKDVNINELQGSLDSATGDAGSGGGGTGSGGNAPANEERPGAVGSGGEIFNQAAA